MVSLSHTLASLSDDDMMALVGPAAWANGLRLARSGAVREFSWSEDGEQAEARVKEAGLTYRVRVAQGAVRPSLACACPLRSDCPHTVATLIVGRSSKCWVLTATAWASRWPSSLMRMIPGSSRLSSRCAEAPHPGGRRRGLRGSI